MKIPLARLLVMVGLVVMLVGFADAGKAWAQGPPVVAPSITYRNGSALGLPLTALICRGIRVNEIDEIDPRASETLVIFGEDGDTVTVERVDATGPIIFADQRTETRLDLTIGRARQIEVRLRATRTEEVLAPGPIHVTIGRAGAPPTELDSDGGIAFVLHADPALQSEGFPIRAPRADGTTEDHAGILYWLQVKSQPPADAIQRAPVDAKVRIRGQIEFTWSATFPADAGADSSVLFRRGGESLSNFASLTEVYGLIRKEVPLPGGPLPRTVDGKLDPIDISFRETESFPIGGIETWGVEAAVDIARTAGGAAGSIVGDVNARKPVVVELIPICPF